MTEGALGQIAKKELREITRDGRFTIVAAATLLLLVAALAFGLRQSAAVRAERAAAQASADEHFREQDDKNPHVAAHYGTYVFKPSGALTFVDPGVEPFVGSSVKLEAHRRNALEGARAQDSTSIARVGRLSVAAVLQLLVPLLVIGLGFSAWTSERERGTLRMLAASGVRPGVLFGGKVLGLAAALAGVLVPAALVIVGAAMLGGVGHAPAPRALSIAAAYAAYFGVFVALALGVSARSRSSRGALVALLGLWVVWSLAMPRAVLDVAALASPVPGSSEVQRAVAHSLERGLPGGAPREARVEAITEAMLEEQGFAGAETLMDPALLGAVELQAEARYESEVIDFHFAEWERQKARQERVAAWLGALAPPVAMRSLSSALAGTDEAHHRHFADAAEAHRRAFVDMLNREIAEHAGEDVWAYRAGRETWARAPAFRYEPPPLGWALSSQGVNAGSLLLWLVFASAFAWWSGQRVRVV